ncbi:MAG: transposase [Candidatus Cloacimonetes bacterium]|nr:transposase [Candidatus Cloacimonadota bacterium]
MQNLEFREFYKRNLPHIQPEGGVFAITFRLAFTLPVNVVEELSDRRMEYARMASLLKGKDLELFDIEFRRKYYEHFDDFIGKHKTERDWLNQKELAVTVSQSIQYLDNLRFVLHSFCVMPNHVHMIIEPLKDKNGSKYFLLAAILKSIKQYTATECNKILNRSGQFWHHESYDHYIRDERDYFYQTEYLRNNPVKAGLVSNWEDWKYTYVTRTAISFL